MPHGHLASHGHQNHHAHMAADFQKRFWIAPALTLPILVLSPMLQKLAGLGDVISYSADPYVLFGFSSAVFWYGGWPFLKRLFEITRTMQAHQIMKPRRRLQSEVTGAHGGWRWPGWRPITIAATSQWDIMMRLHLMLLGIPGENWQIDG
jgi:hypothetical protein